MSPRLPHIAIVTPYLADANNGNWRTAHRWQQLLSDNFKVIVHNEFAADVLADADMLIALHARRSAAIIQQFHSQFPQKPLVVTLTGTDLYRDLNDSTDSANTRLSLELADALIVLQEDAIQFLPHEQRHKAHVIYQSAKPLTRANKPKGKLDCVVVGHLRAEKSPQTIFQLMPLLHADVPIHILHVGAGLDEKLAAEAHALAAQDSRYRWAGALPHGLTRAAIKRAHLLIHPSIMEGGANVIVEAILSGTPVLASHMSGNIGMLGREYDGYFPVGDVSALKQLLQRCLNDANFLTRLNTSCAGRAKLFLPATERMSLCQLVQGLLDQPNNARAKTNRPRRA